MRVAVLILAAAAGAALADDVKVRETDRVGCIVENEFFVADLSSRTVDGKLEDSGTLRALTFKPAGVTLLRTQNRMHWAPSFQRPGTKGYTSIARWTPVQEFSRRRAGPNFVLERSGHHAEYPEIGLTAKYTFLPGVPYFLFEATMEIRKQVEIFWLRGQEMTMDSLFTHAAWPGQGGKTNVVRFEDRGPLLEKEPIPADVPWVAFLHPEKGYGFGAVVLHYRAGTTANAHTQINDGANDGKYWDRHLVSRVNTMLQPGDRYEEKTAYVLFRTRAGDPLGEFREWERKIRSSRQ